jgi:CheY-like chemotaxis protein
LHRILIADDERDIRRLLCTVLSEPDREFIEAVDGREALQIVVAQRPALAILDWMMPGIDGFEVAHKIRRNPFVANIPIIMISARERPYTALVDSLGIHAYIAKPLDLLLLKTTVGAALPTHAE